MLMTNPDTTTWVDASMASVHLLWHYNVQVPPATVRQWGRRYPGIRRDAGEYRYSLEEVVAHARRSGVIGDR